MVEKKVAKGTLDDYEQELIELLFVTIIICN